MCQIWWNFYVYRAVVHVHICVLAGWMYNRSAKVRRLLFKIWLTTIYRLDVAIFTETWHRSPADILNRQAIPPEYTAVDQVRPTDPDHGGIAIIFRVDFSLVAPFTAACYDVRVLGDKTGCQRLVARRHRHLPSRFCATVGGVSRRPVDTARIRQSAAWLPFRRRRQPQHPRRGSWRLRRCSFGRTSWSVRFDSNESWILAARWT